MTYDYSTGDRLTDRNTYFYTQYQGEPFLNEWQRSRTEARADLTGETMEEISHARISAPAACGSVETDAILDYLLGETEASLDGDPTEEASAWLDRMVQRFEVSKRVYGSYRFTDRGLRAVRDAGFAELGRYVRLGQVLERAYGRWHRTQYLNTLLKVVDTLVSVRSRLVGQQRAAVAKLLEREDEHVVALAAAVEVTW